MECSESGARVLNGQLLQVPRNSRSSRLRKLD
ncbi:unnamed protein product [Allacma fusca]|uniref:Uncharacterized protein n=1 Tax=Allacma fusca TaxID=39272 RepID=A0A8J2KEJ3_9HEXA|nr:unnamed protein product [Allacma fusca]